MWLGWNHQIWSGEVRSIHGFLRNQGGMEISVTVEFGRSTKMEKEILWNKLLELKNTIGDEPWVIMGDFNEVRSRADREGGAEYDEEGAEKSNELR